MSESAAVVIDRVRLRAGIPYPETEGEAMTLLAAEYAKLDAEVARLREPNRWIPCSDNSHPRGVAVLILDSGGQVRVAYMTAIRAAEVWLDAYSDNQLEYPVTHWRPLPEPPEVTP